MDPTLVKNHTPKSTTKKPHPTPKSSTIHNISNHFAKLYANHRILKQGNTPPTLFIQEKGLTNSSCIALTKSNSHHERRIHGPPPPPPDLLASMEKQETNNSSTRTKTVNKAKDNNYSVPVTTINKKNPHQEVVVDVHKALLLARQKSSSQKFQKPSDLMPKGLLRLEKFNEIKRPSSISSSISLGGRRKSFCCSENELADFFCCNGVKIVAVDMPPFMQIHAVDCARKASDSLEKFTSKTLAFTLKKEFDGVYGPAWHCIVGTNFGSFVTHSVGGFMQAQLYVDIELRCMWTATFYIPYYRFDDDANAKRIKASGEGAPTEESDDSKAEVETNSRTGDQLQDTKPDQPKDYIHVRAISGQATDSLSLAERTRREKISERMKILQDLVPGSNKVIGKAQAVDEIINYVLSLQHQVEFLSMKLKAVNSRMNPGIEGFSSKDLAAPPFDATEMIFGQQAPREYAQVAQHEWVHMQVRSKL
ncbi:hypothetical protein ACH5RR_007606 [Cinchona calisaya]|uniref:BHLH domain-containing protein n=1 Tax=Cinchona calisaya TaxID=153742 RepID=A0ABD3A968_9GENT